MAIGLSCIEAVEMLVFAQMEQAPDRVRGVVGGLDVSDTAFMPKEMVNIEPQPPATQNGALRHIGWTPFGLATASPCSSHTQSTKTPCTCLHWKLFQIARHDLACSG
jgi:hypothetical protein